MKTKKEVKTVSKKPNGLTDSELAGVSGGLGIGSASGEYGLIEIGGDKLDEDSAGFEPPTITDNTGRAVVPSHIKG